MRKIEPPKILVDLYRDLRDRKLLLPFGLLAAALVLVPLALSKSSHPSPPPAIPSSSSEVSAAQPAVLTSVVGVRNYNKRLAALKEKDPFKRHFRLPKLPGGNPGRLAPPPQTTSPTSTPVTPAPPVGGTTGAVPVGGGSTTTATTTTHTVTAPSHPTRQHLYRAVVDLKIGLPTKLVRRNGLKPVTELPHASNPVVALLGATLDRSSATFLVSRNIGSVQGGSACAPIRSACQILTMKPGGKAKLTDSARGKTYVLKVLEIRLQRVKLADKPPKHHHSSGGGSGGTGGSRDLGPSGMSDFSATVRR